MPYRGVKLARLFEGAEEWASETTRAYAERGAEVMRDRTREHTPVETGELRESWYLTVARKTASLAGPAWEAGTATDVEYAPYVEYGTGLWGPKHAKYPIRPKDPAGWLHWVGKDGEDHFAKLVMHPGSPGQGMLAKGMRDTYVESSVFGPAVLEARMQLMAARWEAEAARGRADMMRP